MIRSQRLGNSPKEQMPVRIPCECGKETQAEEKKANTRKGPWLIHFFARTNDVVPGRDFLLSCPDKVRATMLAALKAVAEAPPPAFSGGGYWEAMHQEMAGYYEVRVDGPQREHFRLFCVLVRDEDGSLQLGGPSLVILGGKSKAFRTVLSSKDYADIRVLGDEFSSTTPRSVERP